MPKISVVIPAYNAESYLHQTIESILSQSFEDFELIIVDHGSTDNTRLIMEKYAKEDDRIILKFLEENRGGGKHAADIGYSVALGEWIVRVDSDDYLSHDSLEALYRKAISSNSDIVLQRMCCFDNETKRVVRMYSVPDSDYNWTTEGKEAVRLTIGKWLLGCNGMLIRKELIPVYKPSNDTVYVNSCEIDTRIYLLNAKKISFCDSSYMYRLHLENSGKKPSIKRIGLLHVDEILESFLRDNYLQEDRIFEDMTYQKGKRLLAFQWFVMKYRSLFKPHELLEWIKVMNGYYRRIDHKLFKGPRSKLVSIALRITNVLLPRLVKF